MPPPVPGAADAARTELALAAFAVGILAKSGKNGPDSRTRNVLGQIRDAHLDHVDALRSADPRQPSSGLAARPRAAQVPSEADDAVSQLIRLETNAASAHRKRIVGPADELVLVWASLSAAARSCADVLDSGHSRSAPTRLTREPLGPLSEVAALEQLLTQVFACLYGYQAAVPHLSTANTTAATARITTYYQLRDRLTAMILARGQQPPAAEADYQLSPNPSNAAAASQLVRGMERRMQPYLGQWVRTSLGADRQTALDTLMDTVDVALDYGAPLDRWPAWPANL